MVSTILHSDLSPTDTEELEMLTEKVRKAAEEEKQKKEKAEEAERQGLKRDAAAVAAAPRMAITPGWYTL